MIGIDAKVFRNSEREFTKNPAKLLGFPCVWVLKYFKKQSIYTRTKNVTTGGGGKGRDDLLLEEPDENGSCCLYIGLGVMGIERNLKMPCNGFKPVVRKREGFLEVFDEE